MIEEKTYTVKKGQEDWRVWTRATDFLEKLMSEKRRSTFKIRRLKRLVKVSIKVEF